MMLDDLDSFGLRFARLPHRLLYAGEFISIQLVGLEPGRSLIRYSPPESILLLVACGRVHVRALEQCLQLDEGGNLVLEPSCEYDLTTDTFADLLLITLPKRADESTAISRTTEDIQTGRVVLSLA
jgi:hypothetical protein